MKAFSPKHVPIMGTLERIPGVCPVIEDAFQRGPTGALVFDHYDTGTEISWDGQVTVTRKGLTVFVDDDGGEWTEDQLILVESEADLPPLPSDDSIRKFLDVSTKHISPETRDVLESGEGTGNVIFDDHGAKGEYGWWIYAPEDPEDLQGFPDDLRAICELARQHGCSWICLDRDADEIAGLKTWEW
jgi:hypothetical protein